MEKSIDRSSHDQHVGKDDLKTSKKRSALASSKLGAGRVTNEEKLAGQLGKCQQSNLLQATKLQSIPVMKRNIEKSAGAGPKVLSVYNLRSKDPITEGAKDSQGYNLRSKVQKTEGRNVSTKIIPQKDGSVSKRIHKKESQRSPPLKISAPLINKNLTTFMASLDKKDQPLTSQYEPYFSEPMYHIRWEGDDMEDDGPVGQNCIICNKDLSGVVEDDDSEEDDDDLQYEHDEEDDDDVLDYYDELNPPLLPAVDILVCGHAYHTECFEKGTPEKQSSDPECPFCSKKA